MFSTLQTTEGRSARPLASTEDKTAWLLFCFRPTRALVYTKTIVCVSAAFFSWLVKHWTDEINFSSVLYAAVSFFGRREESGGTRFRWIFFGCSTYFRFQICNSSTIVSFVQSENNLSFCINTEIFFPVSPLYSAMLQDIALSLFSGVLNAHWYTLQAFFFTLHKACRFLASLAV